MSAEAPTPRQLRRLGAVVILLILGAGFALSKLPELLRPESQTWIATVPLRDGADGLQVGSRVLVGGIQRGQVIGVQQIDGEKDASPSAREQIRVDFELDREIVLTRNAVIRRGASTAGNIGFLNISYPGGPSHRFGDGEQRIIPITRSAPRGGPMAGVIGRTNGELMERITSRTGRFASDTTERSRVVRTELESTRSMIQEMDLQLGHDTTLITSRIQALSTRYREIIEMIPIIKGAARQLEAEVDLEADDLRERVEQWRRRLTLIDVAMAEGREDIDEMQRFADGLEPRLQAVALDLQSAMEDADSVAIRARMLAPEISDGLNRTMARMVLAGGQLKRAIKDLVPLAIEAITTRPNRASLSRRRLLESTNDVVMAGMQLRDAARFLEVASRQDRSGVARDSMPPPNLDESLRLLEETMNRLAERLRQEIETDLR